MNLVDAEDVAKAWVLSTDVAGMVSNKVFLAMPVGAPNPCITLSRVGGAPPQGSATNEDIARISFTVYGPTRPVAKNISKALASELVSVSEGNPVLTSAGMMDVSELISWIWSPDPQSDAPRYILDANVLVRST